MGSSRSFATATAMCWACHKNKKNVKCEVCELEQNPKDFDAEILTNHKFHDRKAVCLQCEELGYSPADTASYTCQSNGGHRCGHLAFNRMYSKRRSGKFVCKACAETTLKCIGCKTDLPRKAFYGSMWNH